MAYRLNTIVRSIAIIQVSCAIGLMLGCSQPSNGLEELFEGSDSSRQVSVVTCEEAAEVKDTTRKELLRGRQEDLASIILDRRFANRRWYPYVELAFAEAWGGREMPITMAASARSVEALKAIAVSGDGREARVAAATAIAKNDPALARKVFEREYGAFGVVEGYEWAIPSTVGDELANLGVSVPAELATVRDAAVLLTIKDRLLLDPSRLKTAADIYNLKLRSLMAGGKMAELRALCGTMEKLRLLQSAWDSAEGESQAEQSKSNDRNSAKEVREPGKEKSGDSLSIDDLTHQSSPGVCGRCGESGRVETLRGEIQGHNTE